MAKERLLKIKPYKPGRPIDEVKRELNLRDVIKLASNENPYPPSPKVLKAIQKEALNINRYPDGGCFYLRQSLTKKLKVDDDQLIFGNGSDEVIIMALRAFVDEGDEVVIAKPSFLVYEIGSKVVGANIKQVPLKNFRYDLDGMSRAVTKKTKVVFIGNPDNPAGTYVTDKELKKFLKSLRKDIIVFVDEAYFEYVKNNDYPDTISLLRQYKNIIISRTFSKMYGLAGLRIGYGIGHPDIIDILNRVREPFNVNSIAQAAALACLKDKKYYNNISKKIEEQRQYLYSKLDDMNLFYMKTVTNFIPIDVQVESKIVTEKLLAKGIIVRDMSFWGLGTFIRISIGTEKENKRFIKTLKKICKEIDIK